MKITDSCIFCGACMACCPVEAISTTQGIPYIDQDDCIECGMCIEECPVNAIVEGFSGNFLTVDDIRTPGRTRAKDLLAHTIISGGFAAVKFAVGTVAVSAGFIDRKLANNICKQISRLSKNEKDRLWRAYESTGRIGAIFEAL